MFFDVGKDINLVYSTLFKFFVFLKSAYFNNFDCVLLRIEFVSGSVYLSVGSFTNDLVESVIFDDSNHILIIKIIKNKCVLESSNK